MIMTKCEEELLEQVKAIAAFKVAAAEAIAHQVPIAKLVEVLGDTRLEMDSNPHVRGQIDTEPDRTKRFYYIPAKVIVREVQE